MAEEDQDQGDVPNGWGDIPYIHYGFDPHCAIAHYPKVHCFLRQAIGGTIFELEDLFETPERETFRPDAVEILRQKITESITAMAMDTTRPNRIEPIINRLPLQKTTIESGRGSTTTREIRIMNTARLEDAFIHSRAMGYNSVTLNFGIHPLQFRKGITFNPHNFDHIGTASDPPEEEEISTPEPRRNDTSPAAATQMTPDVIKAMAAAFKELNKSDQTNTSKSTDPITGDPDYYNTSSLPDDVATRVDNKHETNRLMTRKEMTQFKTEIKDIRDASGNTYLTQNYYYIPNDKLVMRDGTLFKLNRSEKIDKKFASTVPKLRYSKDKIITPLIIRLWYKDFTDHCIANQVFVCPYYCFRSIVGDPNGFTCGKDTHHMQYDLPATFQFSVKTWSGWIATAIREVFPEGSEQRGICQSFKVNGYAALARIILPYHPDFFEYGTILSRKVPVQRKGMSLQDYYNEYVDYLELRAYQNDNPNNLNDFDEMSRFLSGCRWGNQILEKVRDDRLSTNETIARRFTQGQILHTLQIVLPRIDHTRERYEVLDANHKDTNHTRTTTKKRPSRPHRTFTDRRKSDRSPRNEKVHVVQEFDALAQALEEIPQEAEMMAGIYSVGIKRAKTSGFDTSQQCMVCRGSGHTFEDCPILNNHELIKQFHIKFCGLCKQVRKRSDDALTSTVNQIHATDASDDDETESDGRSYDEDSDNEDQYLFL